MPQDMMDLQALVGKSPDADFLREMIGFAGKRLMELEVGGLTALPTARKISRPGPAYWLSRARLGDACRHRRTPDPQLAARGVTSQAFWNPSDLPKRR
jgi:hypothetical protein